MHACWEIDHYDDDDEKVVNFTFSFLWLISFYEGVPGLRREILNYFKYDMPKYKMDNRC